MPLFRIVSGAISSELALPLSCFNYHTARRRRRLQLFQGNSNTHISEMRNLDPPMIAMTVRFVPYSVRPQTVCMRVELYGCPWQGPSLII